MSDNKSSNTPKSDQPKSSGAKRYKVTPKNGKPMIVSKDLGEVYKKKSESPHSLILKVEEV